MSNEAIATILKAVITIVITITSTFVIPWIKSRIDADKLAKIEDFAIIFVRSAEQLYKTEEWQAKKDYALAMLTKKINDLGLELTATDINAIIESAVNYVKYGSEYKKVD